jgi:hypothetical protein
MSQIGELGGLATRWEEESERRRAAQEQQRSGAALARFTVVDMFLDKSVRGRLVPAF